MKQARGPHRHRWLAAANARVGMLALVVAAFALVTPTATADEADRPIVIGAKSFPESRLLAEIMAQTITSHTGREVERRINLGGTQLVYTALTAGDIDGYVEYTGTGWAVLLDRTDRPVNALHAYDTVARFSATELDLTWLAPFGFNNGYALAVRQDTADALGVRTMSDLAATGDLEIALSHEFMNRDDGWPGVVEAYGFDAEPRGIEHGLSYGALAAGEIDVTDTYTTDGNLARYDLVLLIDDRGFFPPYDAAPVLRTEVAEAYPDVVDAIGRLAFRIDDATMQGLNARVEVDGEAFEAVAHDWLTSEGLLGEHAIELGEMSTARGDDGFFAYASGQLGVLAARTAEHLLMTALAVLLAVLVAVPLGIAATRRPGLKVVVTLAGIIQTIPSLALLALLIPVPGLGLGVRTAVVALVLYALLPILRNTSTAIEEVDPTLVEAARGMGLTDRQVLTRVQLPLAASTILAGVRTAAVIAVGFATLAAFIGAGGLGEPILTGLQLNDARLILAGAVPAALLAVAVDAGFAVLERRLVPRGMGP